MNAASANPAAPEVAWSNVRDTQRDTSLVSEKDLPFVAWYKPEVNPVPSFHELRVGDLCPKCQAGHMDYDGVLNLACSECGYALSGGAGCT